MTEQKREVRRVREIFGVPIAWIAVSAAILGATSLIPTFPYPGGGGYEALSFAIICPFMGVLLGPWAGSVAGLLGMFIGMLIAPAGFAPGIPEVIHDGLMPPLTLGLAGSEKKSYRILFVILFVFQIALDFIMPYRWPGPAGGYAPINEPTWTITYLPFLIWLPIYLTPLGWKYTSQWIKSKDYKRMFAGLFLVNAYSSSSWYFTWWWWYNLIYYFPPELNTFANLYHAWEFPLKYIVSAPLYIAIIVALRRGGFRKVPGALW